MIGTKLILKSVKEYAKEHSHPVFVIKSIVIYNSDIIRQNTRQMSTEGNHTYVTEDTLLSESAFEKVKKILSERTITEKLFDTPIISVPGSIHTADIRWTRATSYTYSHNLSTTSAT